MTDPTHMPWHRCSKIAHRTIQSTSQGKNMPVKRLFYLLLLFASLLAAPIAAHAQNGRWTADQANQWYAKQPWLVGANFIPSDAINELEMFQAATFNPGLIDKELGI